LFGDFGGAFDTQFLGDFSEFSDQLIVELQYVVHGGEKK
jgi:hypothetical protein